MQRKSYTKDKNQNNISPLNNNVGHKKATE